MSHEYPNDAGVFDALTLAQYHLAQKTATEVPDATTPSNDSDYEREHQWREATRELVLVEATVMAAAEPPQSQFSISITLTGNALSNDLLLGETGIIVLTSCLDPAAVDSHPMRVLPMRLDILSDVPAVRVLGRNVSEPTRLRVAVELTARNLRTDSTSLMRCEYDRVLLDAQTPLAIMDFRIPHDEPHPERSRRPTILRSPKNAPADPGEPNDCTDRPIDGR